VAKVPICSKRKTNFDVGNGSTSQDSTALARANQWSCNALLDLDIQGPRFLDHFQSAQTLSYCQVFGTVLEQFVPNTRQNWLISNSKKQSGPTRSRILTELRNQRLKLHLPKVTSPISQDAHLHQSYLSRETGDNGDSSQWGFTLLEMLIVLALIGIVASIAVPSYRQSVLRAREAVLRENLFSLRSTIERFALDQKRPILLGSAVKCR